VSFANLRRALRPGGRLVFVCWRERPANPWLIAPYRAILPHVAAVPEVGPDDPGPFAFAREDRVRGILGDAGFGKIALERCDFMLDLAIGRGLEAAVTTALEMGPASRLIDKQPPEFRPIAARAIRDALAPAVVDTTVPLAASVWMVTAVNP
jgi:SAM-dependent methyltransferase